MPWVPAPHSCLRPQVPQQKRQIIYYHLYLKCDMFRNVGTRLGFSLGHITPMYSRFMQGQLDLNLLESCVLCLEIFFYRKSSCYQVSPNEQKTTEGRKSQRPLRRVHKGILSLSSSREPDSHLANKSSRDPLLCVRPEDRR